MKNIIENSVRIRLFEEDVILLPQKAMYFVKDKMLLAADLHIGKTGFFREAGIPVPSELAFTDLHTLDIIFSEFEIHKFIILGDLFHASMNIDWKILSEWRSNYSELTVQLVRGNHDVFKSVMYEEMNIEIADAIRFKNFLFVHNLNRSAETDSLYKIGGHVHPAVRLSGRARQGLTLPCFYFADTFAILPAFGRFTGRYVINARESDSVFVITGRHFNQKVFKV